MKLSNGKKMSLAELEKSLLLYAVTDRAWTKDVSLYEQVEQTLKGGTTFVQLREKDLPYEDFFQEGKEIQELCKKYQVPFVINDNVQLKAAFQYQLHFGSPTKGKGLSSNLEGATYADYKDMQNRPKFDELDKQVAGKNHNCLFSISAIFNFGKWYEDRLITY